MSKKEIKIANRKKLRTKKDLKSAKDRLYTLVEDAEAGEYELTRKASVKKPERKVRFPKDVNDRFGMMPNEFITVQNGIEACQFDARLVEVVGDSIESFLGYDSLIRIMNKWFGDQVAYYRTEEGGNLSVEQARKAVYGRKISDEDGKKLLGKLLRTSTERINFRHLSELNDYSPAVAQNLWELIKREASIEFESGHRAAAVFEPVDYMTDCWTRASYIGLRESFVDEWQPKGAIELSMIDTIVQAWLMLQHWTEQSVLRSKTRPRSEDHEFAEWKKWNRLATKQWSDGNWDIPHVKEQDAIEHATQMADRWQRMYFRAIRSLRDWRRYTPQVTINNPNQVNIATDGGQQINVNKIDSKEEETKKLNS